MTLRALPWPPRPMTKPAISKATRRIDLYMCTKRAFPGLQRSRASSLFSTTPKMGRFPPPAASALAGFLLFSNQLQGGLSPFSLFGALLGAFLFAAFGLKAPEKT